MRQWYKHVVGIETSSSSSTKDHIGMRLVVVMFLLRTFTHQKYLDNNQKTTNSNRRKGSKRPRFYKHHWEQGCFTARTISEVVGYGCW